MKRIDDENLFKVVLEIRDSTGIDFLRGMAGIDFHVFPPYDPNIQIWGKISENINFRITEPIRRINGEN